ncbi:MAG: PD40 domain-containing protein [Fimbriimonadaceae bacterium]|nr:PD40 domain-containing protein [Fimbriimonadaceae bacterium]
MRRYTLRRAAQLAAGLLAAAALTLGCSGDETSFAEGVRVDQLLARDVTVTVTDDRAVVTWITRDPVATRLDYGPTAGLGSVAGSQALATVHRVELTGLAANTTLFYRVNGSGLNYRLRTLGGTSGRLAFVSDRSNGRREVFICFEWGENVERLSSGGGWDPALSRDGRRLVWTGPGAGGRPDLFAADLDAAGLVAGSIVNLTNTAGREEGEADWSPDATRLVFVAATPGAASQVLLRTVADGAEQVLVANGATNSGPVWKPSGTAIAFASTTRTATIQLGVRPVDPGSLQVVLNDVGQTVVDSAQFLLVDAAQGLVDCSGSTVTNREILVSYTSNGTPVTNEGHGVPRPHLEIYTVAPNGSGLRRLTDSGENVARFGPCWHPTADLVAFVSESGQATNLQSVAGTGGGIAGITRGAYLDRDPVFSPDGLELLFSSNRHENRLVNLHRSSLAGDVVAVNLFSSGDTQPCWSVVP